MTYTYHVVIAPAPRRWNVTCPALENHGAVSAGATKEEALAHIHNVILMILQDMEAKAMMPPADIEVPFSIPVNLDTTIE